MIKYALIFCFCVSLMGADIISSARRATWEGYVGVRGGIPDASTLTLKTTLSAGATAAQVQSALGTCVSNEYVKLNAGAYTWTGNLDWQGVADGVVLIGSTNASGEPTAVVTFNSGLVYMRRIYDAPGANTVALSANGTKGSQTLTVGSVPAWLKQWGVYYLNEQNDAALIIDNTGEEGADELIAGRAMGHLILITNISGTTLTIDAPLPYTYRTSQSAQIATANHDPNLGANHAMRKRCGIQDVKFIGNYTGSRTSHTIMMENAEECWVKNVESDTVPGGIHVMIYGGYRCEVRHSRFYNSKLFGGGEGYGVAAYQGGGGHLIEDNIFYDLHVPIQFNYSTAQSVAAYNYIGEGIASVEQEPGMNQHGVVAFQILWEGNYSVPKFMSDGTHGSGGYASTIFRNRIEGHHSTYNYDRSVINLRYYSARDFNIVGNILGKVGYHTIYERQADAAYNSGGIGSPGELVVYVLGYGVGAPFDDATELNMVRHVNYNSVSGMVLGDFTTDDLVDSYYLPAKPSWYGALTTWPPFGPDISTNLATITATNIPAGWRYVTGTDTPQESGGGGSSGASDVNVTELRIGTIQVAP